MEKTFEKLAELEAQNLGKSSKGFAREIVFAEELWDLYAIEKVDSDLRLPAMFFAESRNALLLAVLSILRCHNAQALSNLRFATECASYGYKTKDSMKAQLWISGNKDSEFRKEFRKKRFDEKHPLIQELKETWEFASNFASHATLGSTLGHQEQVSQSKINFEFSDIIDVDHVTNRRRIFCLIIKTHLKILGIFDDVFGKALSDEWRRTRNKIQIEFTDFWEKEVGPEAKASALDRKRRKFSKAGLIVPTDGMLSKLVGIKAPGLKRR